MDEKQEDCYQFLNTLDMMVLSYIYQKSYEGRNGERS